MASRRRMRAKFVTGERSVGSMTVNPWNYGLGKSDGPGRGGRDRDRSVGRGPRRKERAEPVRPKFHAAGATERNGNPYHRLRDLLEELTALRELNILAPDRRDKWTSDRPPEDQHDVRRCVARLQRLTKQLGANRYPCAARWTVRLGQQEYRIHALLRAVLGDSAPPLPFDEWVLTVPVPEDARVKKKAR